MVLPEEEFEGIEIINSELIKEFKEDRKAILDVRVKTKVGKPIDVEIQILPSNKRKSDSYDGILRCKIERCDGNVSRKK